jgi:hypothetical protein
MDDPREHPAIIDPPRTLAVDRQQWLDPRPLIVRKPKETSHSQRLLAGGIESHDHSNGNPFIGSGP